MRDLMPSVIMLLGALVLAPAAGAEVFISIDKTTQRMSVSVDGKERYSWPVSTGMADYATPAGNFTPSRMARTHFSREWDNAPMPHSIFFTDAGHAIHGSHAVGRLGTPASHGCVRLAPANAKTLFSLVEAEGLDKVRIEITGVDSIGIGLGGGSGMGRDYSRITSFDPLAVGIMSGSYGPRRGP
ncbi:L,D-transpeptidase [Microvirga massiliensis]|uniref:L,D-transpeptidase n=1 Tax=Microvirga massiliensis TaxID=1033741 RepID=UPI00062B9560|nr:L,D-transpeptidase [Microvirga massiliensis]